jgi:mannonate dehydratase
MRKRRRRLLIAGGGATALGAAALVWRYAPEQGLVNPCRALLPPALAGHEAVRAAWDGIDPARVWDCHAHLAGTGDSGGGARLNPDLESLAHPVEFAQRLVFLNAACADGTPGRTDQSYIERMHDLLDGMRPGCKLVLLAFDRHYGADGRPVPEHTMLYVPNEYAGAVARRYPRHFEWAASIHPYRKDCVAALERARAAGARAVKWLPSAMGIDPSSSRCDPFYSALARLDVPLITHGGQELALRVGSVQHLGNPLLLRRALDHGVRVVVAHCATAGADRDLDRGPDGPYVESFALFARMMDEPRYERRLFGDLSAVTQVNRAGAALVRLIERTEWHQRLLNGSDYPLPGIMPLYSMRQLTALRVIDPALAPVLAAIHRHNPLLFDFVLKRHLNSAGKHLAPAVFETRGFFAP